jgi:hypothetical protein
MAPKATEEQVLYANILNKGMLLGFIGIIVTFVIYGLGIMEPKVPMDDLQVYWTMPVHDYLSKCNIETGWSWLSHLGCGDMLNLIPIAFLSALTIFCYAAIIPGLVRKKDNAYVVLAVLEVLVLALAASGLLKSGGH